MNSITNSIIKKDDLRKLIFTKRGYLGLAPIGAGKETSSASFMAVVYHAFYVKKETT